MGGGSPLEVPGGIRRINNSECGGGGFDSVWGSLMTKTSKRCFLPFGLMFDQVRGERVYSFLPFRSRGGGVTLGGRVRGVAGSISAKVKFNFTSSNRRHTQACYKGMLRCKRLPLVQ